MKTSGRFGALKGSVVFGTYFLRPYFMTKMVSCWNSPNKALANKGKLFPSEFLRELILCFVAELRSCENTTGPLIINLH